jgi:predicted DNA-binding ribbon-helix-helix protein
MPIASKLSTTARRCACASCVIFATPRDSFYPATVRDGFLVRMSPSRNIWGHWIMESSVVKRSIVVAGHKTSVSLEDEFWKAVKEIASERDLTLSELVGKVESEREFGNLSSAIRLFVLRFYRGQINGYEAPDRTQHMLVDASTAVAATHA